MLTFLVTNLVKNLVITKLSDNFGDNSVNKFGGSPYWVKEQLFTFCTWCPLHPRKDLHWEFYSEPPQQKNLWTIIRVIMQKLLLNSEWSGIGNACGAHLSSLFPRSRILLGGHCSSYNSSFCWTCNRKISTRMSRAVEKFWQVKLLERVMITCDLTVSEEGNPVEATGLVFHHLDLPHTLHLE